MLLVIPGVKVRHQGVAPVGGFRASAPSGGRYVGDGACRIGDAGRRDLPTPIEVPRESTGFGMHRAVLFRNPGSHTQVMKRRRLASGSQPAPVFSLGASPVREPVWGGLVAQRQHRYVTRPSSAGAPPPNGWPLLHPSSGSAAAFYINAESPPCVRSGARWGAVLQVRIGRERSSSTLTRRLRGHLRGRGNFRRLFYSYRVLLGDAW